jgi:hypothetical protein
MAFLKYLGFKFSLHLFSEVGVAHSDSLPCGVWKCHQQKLLLHRKQTQEFPMDPFFQSLLNSSSLSFWKGRGRKVTHCQTIFRYSRLAEILINPVWNGKKTIVK